MSDDTDREQTPNVVLEFNAKPKKVKQTHTFYWVLSSGFTRDLTPGALLSVVFTNGPWKDGDCVKITMVKVEDE